MSDTAAAATANNSRNIDRRNGFTGEFCSSDSRKFKPFKKSINSNWAFQTDPSRFCCGIGAGVKSIGKGTSRATLPDLRSCSSTESESLSSAEDWQKVWTSQIGSFCETRETLVGMADEKSSQNPGNIAAINGLSCSMTPYSSTNSSYNNSSGQSGCCVEEQRQSISRSIEKLQQNINPRNKASISSGDEQINRRLLGNATKTLSKQRQEPTFTEKLQPVNVVQRDMLREQILKSRQLQSALRHVQAEKSEELINLRHRSHSSGDLATVPAEGNDEQENIIPKSSEKSPVKDRENTICQRFRQTIHMGIHSKKSECSRQYPEQPPVEAVGEDLVIHNVGRKRTGCLKRSSGSFAKLPLTPTTMSSSVNSFDNDSQSNAASLFSLAEHSGELPSLQISSASRQTLSSRRGLYSQSLPSNLASSSFEAPEDEIKPSVDTSLSQLSVAGKLNFPSPATAMTRLTRQVVLNNKGHQPRQNRPPRKNNRVKIHIYDLIHSDTWIDTPWGCEFPLGKCFIALNDGLHMMGTGAYHAGLEVNGIEYAYGSSETEGISGVFSCHPKNSPGYEYRTTIDFGEVKTVNRRWIKVPVPKTGRDGGLHKVMTPSASSQCPTVEERKHGYGEEDDEVSSNGDLRAMSDVGVMVRSSCENNTMARYQSPRDWNAILSQSMSSSIVPEVATAISYTSAYRDVETFVEGSVIMKQMSREYMGLDYDLFRKNCCTFVKDACLRLGIREDDIPKWFLNLADVGVSTEDALTHVDANVCGPIKGILEVTGSDDANILGQSDSSNMDVIPEEGFEVITMEKRGSFRKTELEIVRVEESLDSSSDKQMGGSQREDDDLRSGIRETLSWAY